MPLRLFRLKRSPAPESLKPNQEASHAKAPENPQPDGPVLLATKRPKPASPSKPKAAGTSKAKAKRPKAAKGKKR